MNKVKLTVTIVGSGMFFFLLYSFVINNYLGMGYPYNTFLCSKVDSFMDFYNVNYFISDFCPYSSDKEVSYPPFALILAYPFSLFFHYSKYGSVVARESLLAVSSYLILLISFSWYLLQLIYRTVKGSSRLNSFIYTAILFFTYLVFFLFDRGNYIMITFVFLSLFAYYYTVSPSKSLYFLSAAIAMKIYPILFLFLFFPEKRYKDIWKVAIITCCFSVIPMLLFRGEFLSNMTGFVDNLLFFSNGHVNEIQNMSWSSSLSGIIKIPIMLFNQGTVPFNIRVPYLLLVVIFIGVVCFLLKKETRIDRKIVYLVSLQILIMSVSSDYNLVYLYIPLLLLLKNSRALDREDYFSIIVIALLFVPKSYGILFHNSIWAVSIQSFINPVLLLSLIVYPFCKRIVEYFQAKETNKENCSVNGYSGICT